MKVESTYAQELEQGGLMEFKRILGEALALSEFEFGLRLGTELSKEQCIQIRRRLESLEERAPALSSTSLNFRKSDGRFEGILSINGLNKSFFSKAFGATPLEAYIELEGDIDKQLLDWKKGRLLTYYLGTNCHESEGLKGGYVA